MEPQNVREEWPNGAVRYEFPETTAENGTLWKRAIDSARSSGTLRLEKNGKFVHDLVGDCPRCGHKMKQALHFKGVIGAFGQKESGVFNIRCNCVEPHEGRDNGRRGCGWGGPNIVGLSV
ncbi:hypothetical protein A5634_19670 [Mycobacterium asiaticum]|uniref:Uncharacterized protein n=1 Tax=Mycobacterium asiaticum TaxID=1790 RepID=A0A1A3P3W2_MYCAS|nr:hypothetical protein [Mycobacterium asiaticum]OBK28861.1 hypothetical protein A5634_19670 [Mycobacterium asiaticum]